MGGGRGKAGLRSGRKCVHAGFCKTRRNSQEGKGKGAQTRKINSMCKGMDFSRVGFLPLRWQCNGTLRVQTSLRTGRHLTLQQRGTESGTNFNLRRDVKSLG